MKVNAFASGDKVFNYAIISNETDAEDAHYMFPMLGKKPTIGNFVIWGPIPNEGKAVGVWEFEEDPDDCSPDLVVG